MATLQQQVQQYLQNTGISLRELSRRSGVSHTAIGKILRGGTYKSDTANDLIFAMSFYGGDTARPVMQDKAAETLQDKVEQLAAERVDRDRGAWDVDLNCAKYRRVMQLEKELNDEKRNFAALERVHEQREQQLNDANTAYLMSKSQHDRDVQRLNDANAEIKRLTALSETQAASWKAACVQVEQLQKQNDHNQAEFSSMVQTMGSLHATKMIGKSVQLDDCLLRLDSLRTEMRKAKIKHDQQIMRLRVYVWSLIAALVFVVASGLVVWGAR